MKLVDRATDRCLATNPATRCTTARSSGAAWKAGPSNTEGACTEASSVDPWSARRAARIERLRVGSGASNDSLGKAAIAKVR